MSRTRIALVGVGEIARREHVPAIEQSQCFELAAAVTRHAPPAGVPAFGSIAEMMAARPDIQAVSICTPPRGRLDLVRQAVAHGLDMMLEKPPAGTLGEARAIVDLAAEAGRVLHLTWHSRCAAAVEPAKAWLRGKSIESVRVTWKEDVRVWHPGQAWIWDAGVGVFDPGVNAFSVITEILPGPLTVQDALLRFPANKAAPIAADLVLRGLDGLRVDIAFDFDQRDAPPTWDIDVETGSGALRLSKGAAGMAIGGVIVDLDAAPEYRRLYHRFAHLLARRESEADLAPFALVADAFLVGRRQEGAPFNDF